MALFADRVAAGHRLAAQMRERGLVDADAVVVGIARGGVVVAAAVADALGLALSAVAVRKLGIPGHEEVAFGAIAAGERVVHDATITRARVEAADLARVEERERATLARRQDLVGALEVSGRTALLVDDGIATGATANVACRATRAAGAARVALAVPVAPTSWRPEPGVADDYVCLHTDDDFWAVGAYYDDFTQTTDEEVARLLAAGRSA
jgi:putative phosphoribosyl transferase